MSDQIIDYKILAAKTSLLLQEQVMRFLKSGYELYGFPMFIDYNLCQTVVLYKGVGK